VTMMDRFPLLSWPQTIIDNKSRFAGFIILLVKLLLPQAKY
jgi:hypothetical protein